MAMSAFETLLINNIVEAMTKAIEQAIIDGDGTGKPKGILQETPADGQTIDSAAPAYADLITVLPHSFLHNRSTLQVCLKASAPAFRRSRNLFPALAAGNGKP